MEAVIKRNQITLKRASTSLLQTKWIDWQEKTYPGRSGARLQLEDFEDAGVYKNIKTIREWRRGQLPGGINAWLLIRAFGLPLMIALFGDMIADSYAIMEENHERERQENLAVGRAIMCALRGDATDNNLHSNKDG